MDTGAARLAAERLDHPPRPPRLFLVSGCGGADAMPKVDPSGPPFAPRGDRRHLDAAVAVLGDAPLDGGAAARAELELIATAFNEYTFADDIRPRWADIRDDLVDLADAADALAKLLVGLSDEAHDHILDVVNRFPVKRSGGPPAQLLGHPLPDPIDEALNRLYPPDEDEPDHRLSAPIVALSGLARAAAVQIEPNQLNQKVAPSFDTTSWNPKRLLVASCGKLLYSYGIKVSGASRGGSLIKITNSIYAYATGENPKKARTGLSDYCVEIGKLFRILAEVEPIFGPRLKAKPAYFEHLGEVLEKIGPTFKALRQEGHDPAEFGEDTG